MHSVRPGDWSLDHTFNDGVNTPVTGTSVGRLTLQLVTEVLPTVLLVDDTEEDAILFKRAYKGASIPNPLRVVHDGDDAIAYLSGTGKFGNRDEHSLPQLVCST